MSKNYVRLPVRFVEDNAELLKSQSPAGGEAGATDWKATETIPMKPPYVEPSYTAPRDRNIGHVLFRRNLDGTLDYGAAKDVVVESLERAKAGQPLAAVDEMVLGIVFPTLFPNFVDPRIAESMMTTFFRLNPWEVPALQIAVGEHLNAVIRYRSSINGGLG